VKAYNALGASVYKASDDISTVLALYWASDIIGTLEGHEITYKSVVFQEPAERGVIFVSNNISML
jgi:hypothetical protein